MYKIIGGDQKEYGPVTAEQLRRWIAEGRVNGQTPVQPEGSTEWKPVSTFPEFADLFAAAPAAGGPPPFQESQPGLPVDIFQRDYDLDIGRCVSDSWEALKNNFGLIFGGTAIFLLIQIGFSVLGRVPFIGIALAMINFIITGPLTGGLYYFLLKNIRRQPVDIGDVFSGFRLAFVQLLLGYLVTAILTTVSALPGLAIMAYPVYLMFHQHAVSALLLLWACLGFVVLLIPAIYLSVSWLFALPLIIDKQMEFWPAMEASRKMVGKHWWAVFGLVVVSGLINIAGFLLCCVGLFISMPIAFGAMMCGYERIFSAPASQTR